MQLHVVLHLASCLDAHPLKRNLFLICAVSLLGIISISGASGQVPAGTALPLGLNVDFNEQAYVNMIQPLTTFEPTGSSPLVGDTNGWPTADFSWTVDNRYTFAWVSTATNIDPLKESTDLAGAWTLSFTGSAVLGGYGMTIGNQKYVASTNTTTATVTIPNPAGGAIWEITFTNTKRLPGDTPGDGLTNVKFIRPGTNTDPNFTNLWLGAIENYNWSALRLMGALGTNSFGETGSNEAYPYVLEWPTDRTIPGDGPLYQSNPGVHGIPWEYVILLANKVNRDIWINIPVNASSTPPTDSASFVYQLAELLKNGDAFTNNVGLNPDINIYLEYSNEMWHLGFPQGPWNEQAAIDQVNAGNSNLNYDGTTDVNKLRMRRIAQQTVQIGQIFRSVFTGNPQRIRPVINNAWVDQFDVSDADMMTYVSANYGPPSDFLYGLAMTGYYSSSNTSSVSDIQSGEMASSNSNVPWYQLQRTIATFFGLHSLVYEGGEGDTSPDQDPGPPTDPNLGFLFESSRSAGMAQVEENDLLTNWFPSGGDLYMQFSEVGRYSVYGFWGLSDDLADQTTGKWEGAIDVMKAPAPAVTAGTLLPSVLSHTSNISENSSSSAVSFAPGTLAYMWLLRVPTTGLYSLTFLGDEQDSTGALNVWVDNKNIGTTSMPVSPLPDGNSTPVNMVLTAGHHSVFVYAVDSAGGSSVFAPGESATFQLVALPTVSLDSGDAYVRSGSYANTNFGSTTAIMTEHSSVNNITTNNRCAYLKLNLTGITGQVYSARLLLDVSAASKPAGSTQTLNIYSLPSASWNPSTITWNNAPGLDRANISSTGALLSSEPISLSSGQVSIDITSFVAANTGNVVTLQLLDPAADSHLLILSSHSAKTGAPALSVISH